MAGRASSYVGGGVVPPFAVTTFAGFDSWRVDVYAGGRLVDSLRCSSLVAMLSGAAILRRCETEAAVADVVQALTAAEYPDRLPGTAAEILGDRVLIHGRTPGVVIDRRTVEFDQVPQSLVKEDSGRVRWVGDCHLRPV